MRKRSTHQRDGYLIGRSANRFRSPPQHAFMLRPLFLLGSPIQCVDELFNKRFRARPLPNRPERSFSYWGSSINGTENRAKGPCSCVETHEQQIHIVAKTCS
jgi:hypothetical protein